MPSTRDAKRFVSQFRNVHLASLLARVRPEKAADGLPLPPPSLRYLVGVSDADAFVRSGQRLATVIRDTLARQGVDLEQLGAILDFGCGAGRMVRQWVGLQGVEIHGCDYNARLVEWCRRGLPFASFEVNRLEPPLPYSDGKFGLVYAYSVFTHLPAALQLPWMEELHRVLRPGGYLLFTTHGASFAATRLTAEERERFDRDELVVHTPTAAGTNPYAAFHPPTYVRETLARQFEVLEHVEGAGPDATPGAGRRRQDTYLLRRPGP